MTLEVLGLDPDVEHAYRRLLVDPDVTITDQLCGRLQELNLLDQSGVPRPPTALEDLADAQTEALARRQRDVVQARSDIAGLVASAGTGARSAGVERLAGVDDVRERLDELSFFARHSIFAVQPQQRSPAARAAAVSMDRRSLRRRLDLRVLTDDLRPHPAGVMVRTTREPLERLILIDEQTAVMPDEDGGALVVTAAPLVRRLAQLFAQWWSGGRDDRDPLLAECDVALLGRLADGSTDEQIARDLGISTRQLRRRIARVCQQLGARTRFAAGLEAGRNGWLATP